MVLEDDAARPDVRASNGGLREGIEEGLLCSRLML